MSNDEWPAGQPVPEDVSAIIPTVNRPKEVARAVASALTQSHLPREVIVVHDGRDPRAVADLARFKDARVRIIQTDRPSGDAGATARNLGVSAATGHWVAFLDDDDEWLPNKLRAQLDIAIKHSHPDRLVVSARVERRTPGEPSKYWPLRAIGESERVADYLFVRRRPGEGWLPTPTLMTTRALALGVPFRVGMKQHEDYDWLLNLEKRGALFVVSEDVLAVVHANSANGSMSRRATWEASLEWARARRSDLGEVAYSSFCLSDVTRSARRTPSVKAFTQIGRAALQGRPRARDIAKFAAHWVLPERAVRAMKERMAQPFRDPEGSELTATPR